MLFLADLTSVELVTFLAVHRLDRNIWLAFSTQVITMFDIHISYEEHVMFLLLQLRSRELVCILLHRLVP